MSGKPTLGTVAREAGVSIPTVSQVLRGTGRISEQTRKRVLAAAKKLRYVPDSRAAAMRSGQSREIGFVINQFANPFNAEVVSGAVDLLETEDYLVSVLDMRDDAGRQDRQLQAVIRHGRGGLLWVPALATPPETIALLTARRLPTVTFLRPASDRIDHVGIRNADATGTATRHLADLGHRHIAYFGGTDMTHVRRKRVEGYTEALAERGLPGPVVWPSSETKRAGSEAIIGLLSEHPDVTAIVCNGDVVALGACLGLTRASLRPGHDVSVIGFDDIGEAAVADPPLSTMAVSPYRLGARLARVLLDRIRDPDAPATVSETTAELVARKTTGPVPEGR